MASGKVGVALHESTARGQIDAIVTAERLGVANAWLTTGGVGPDAMAIFAASAVQTSRIGLGTAIIPTWPRHPLTVIQSAVVVSSLAPGRFRLGVGPSHKPTIEGMYGIPFEKPLSHLREYLRILKAALQEGPFELEGEHYRVKGRVPDPPRIPVLLSALRPASYRLAGEESDGALAWICPLPYLRDQARPALEAGAAKAGRAVPPLIGHCFAAVHDDVAQARETARGRLGYYLRMPSYVEMFVQAGFPEARDGAFTDRMVDAVAVVGDEAAVARGLRAYLDAGLDEMIASVVVVGDDHRASLERTMKVVASL